MAKTRSHGSIEEEEMEMENRIEILKIQEKLEELDTLKSDVAEIKKLLFTKFSQTSMVGAETRAMDLRGERPVLLGHKEKTTRSQELEQRVGAPTTFFLESNTVIPNFPPVFPPAIHTTSQVDMRDRSGVNQGGSQQPMMTSAPLKTHGFNHGRGVPAMPPWTWQNTDHMAASQMYYHPVLNTNSYQETHFGHNGMMHQTTNSGVNVIGPLGNMNWNASGNSHQYADAVLKGPKLELSLFSGDDPSGWLEQCEKFFEMAGTPREQWVNLATGHFVGRAHTWSKGISIAWQVLNWQQLCSMISDRFSAVSAHEAVEKLQTMKHIGNVGKYIDYFEKYVELVRRDHPYLQEAFLMSCLIGGLKEEIKYGVSIHQPKGLLEVYWYAKLEEKATLARRTNHSGGFNKNKTNGNPHRTEPARGIIVEGNEKGKTPGQEGNQRTCWHCKEPWVPGHHLKCKVNKALHVILMQGEEEVIGDLEDPDLNKDQGFITAPGSPEEDEGNPETEQILVISSQAKEGIVGPATFSLLTMIGGKQAVMLVDSGSTNSFMYYEFAVKSDCKIRYQPAKRVAVAGGGELSSEARTEQISYLVQGHLFTHSFQLLNLGSYDIILGTDWIYEHSPIGLNLKTRELAICKEGSTVLFKDYTTPDKHYMVRASKLKKILKKEVLGTKLVIRTDQKSLRYITTQRLVEGIQHKLLLKLLEFDYIVEYKKGKENLVADALSRRDGRSKDEVEESHAIVTVIPDWVEDVKGSYVQDPQYEKVIGSIQNNDGANNSYTIEDELVRHKGRIYVGVGNDIRSKILESFHTSSIGGHSGIRATYHRIKKLFYWPRLKKDVELYVAECPVCQVTKSEHTHMPGLLNPLEILDMAWTHISMDFIEGLPKSRGKEVILVVVDRFTKYAHFLPLYSGKIARVLLVL